MKRRTYIYLVLVISCLIYSISDYFIAMHRSYDMYLAGDYYFKQTTLVVNPHMSDDWWATPEAQNTDYSDPKNMLLRTTGTSVYAFGPHDGVCTVYYGDNVIEDFPISNLQFENDDAEYFYGRKTYTYEEYLDRIEQIIKDHDENHLLSDKAMYGYRRYKPLMVTLICVDGVLALVLIILYRAELYDKFTLLMFIGALYSILFDVFTSIMLWS